jgi:hypothetical protein
MLTPILEKFNIKFDDLNAAERNTYLQWQQSLANKTLSVALVKDYVEQMADGVQAELVGFTEPKSIWDFLFRRRRQLYLTARLRNYMLLASFLAGPEKAQKALERSLNNIQTKKH